MKKVVEEVTQDSLLAIVVSLHVDVAVLTHDVLFTELLALMPKESTGPIPHVVPEHRLRVHIRSNFYADQCHATIERWDGASWREVYRIAGMQTPRALANKLVAKAMPEVLAEFRADRVTLVRRAIDVLL